MKIIFYEINEISWKLYDAYTKQFPHSAFAKILKHSFQFETVTKDSGELHPWSTWPTLHRGVYNDTHDIRFLNQDIQTNYPPYWQLLAQHKKSVGVFGCLQSWPIPESESYSFYIPDTFSPQGKTLPQWVEPFQKFNLSQTKSDGGTTPQSIKIPKNFWALFRLLLLKIRPKTLFQVAIHLLQEKINPLFKSARSVWQGPLAFDIFFDLLKEKKPSCAIFFTNHLAGMMHRYWKFFFPEDFNYTLSGKADLIKRSHLLKALHLADEQIALLKEFADCQGYILMIGSSMGQDFIKREDYIGELRLSSVETLCKSLDYHASIHNNLAMQPDFSFSFKREQDLDAFYEKVSQLKTSFGGNLFAFKRSGLTLNCNLHNSAQLVKSGKIHWGEKVFSFKELGLSIEQRDPGTGYHIPEGVWIVYNNTFAQTSRQSVESIQVAPTMLDLFGVEKPKYMTRGIQQVVSAAKKLFT